MYLLNLITDYIHIYVCIYNLQCTYYYVYIINFFEEEIIVNNIKRVAKVKKIL